MRHKLSMSMRMSPMTGGMRKRTRQYETQWEEMTNQWESSDHNEQNYEVEDTYATEEVREEQYIADDQDQAESDEFDEDDQDSYI